jgi:hypothetical protein
MEQSPSWAANRFAASQLISRNFMEPECSLPHLKVPATCPYPEPDTSSQFNDYYAASKFRAADSTL